MKTVKTRESLRELLRDAREENMQIALVPTMGALHEGNLDLVRQAKRSADLVVCSIFVNPTQFNDPEDLKKYPRPLERDTELLESAGCDLLFLPAVEEMYQDNEYWSIDLGMLDNILEGKHRPGHFQGVSQIVYKLFDLVQPDLAVFGQKDLQQFQVVEKMIKLKKLPVKLIMAPTVRETDGLAMSSRNIRLSPEGRKQALALYETLTTVREQLANADRTGATLADLRQLAWTKLEKAEGVTPEYFAICERDTLREADEHSPKDKLVALVAAWVDGVRLIDNIMLC